MKQEPIGKAHPQIAQRRALRTEPTSRGWGGLLPNKSSLMAFAMTSISVLMFLLGVAVFGLVLAVVLFYPIVLLVVPAICYAGWIRDIYKDWLREFDG